MAIVKMKRLRIIALAEERDRLLARLLHVGCVEVSEPQEELSDPQWTALLSRGESALADVKQDLAQVTAALRTLSRYAPAKGGLFLKRKAIKEEDFLSGQALETALHSAEAINDREREIAALAAQEGRLAARRAALRPWASLDVDLGTGSTKNVKIAFAVCPAGVDMEALTADLAETSPTAQVIEASADKEQHYFLYLCHRSEEEMVAETLKPYGVSPAGFKDVTGTAIDNIAAIDRESEGLAAQRAALEKEIASYAASRQDLEICTDRLKQEVAKQEAAQRSLTDGAIVFFTGWVTGSGLGAVTRELESFSCAWEAVDPAPEEYPQVPVQLKNSSLVRPLNMVTEMYSLPAYDGVDPNPLMAPFFILFYGIMMADMGYGLLMMLASFLVIRKYRPKGTMGHLFGLLGLCGVSTFFMGAVTGGFFGDFIPQLVLLTTGKEIALPALFTPLDDTLMILVGSMCLGLVQIITGMAISLVEKVKRGEILDAVWEEVTWWVVFAGLALAVLGVTPIVLAIGGVMIVIGSGWNAKGFGKVTAIFGSLYNHVTGYFGDILSYSRLMALMLAGSVIAQVFNTLGAIPGNVVIFIIISFAGNALNFALNLLGCYVHDLRLQCLEYFNKFYKDGGRPFRPLAFDTKYVDVVQE